MPPLLFAWRHSCLLCSVVGSWRVQMKPVTKIVIFPADLDEVSHSTLVLSHRLPDTCASCSALLVIN